MLVTVQDEERETLRSRPSGAGEPGACGAFRRGKKRMHIDPIRDWIPSRQGCDPLRFAGTRCHLRDLRRSGEREATDSSRSSQIFFSKLRRDVFSFSGVNSAARIAPASVLARDERLMLQAGLVELFALDNAVLEPQAADRPPHKLELHWPSDDLARNGPPPVPIIEQTVRPWPPDQILGSIIDLLT